MKAKEQEVVLTPKNAPRVMHALRRTLTHSEIELSARGITVTMQLPSMITVDGREIPGTHKTLWHWGRKLNLIGFEKV